MAMDEQEIQPNELFGYFVVQQQMAAMMYLGKIVRPDTGQVERNLEAARFTIDLLGMLEEKTRGNLTADEAKLIQQVLTTLRLNFVDEAKRGDSSYEPKKEEEAAGADSGGAGTGDHA